MKKSKRKQPRFPSEMKERWDPKQNTRPITYRDKKRVANKEACRKGNY